MIKSDSNLIWYHNPNYKKKFVLIANEILENESKQKNDKKKIEILKIFYLMKNFLKITKSLFLKYFLSIILRLVCIFVLIYVILVMIHETDSWFPLFNLIFCLGIFIDMIYFMSRKKEHTGYFNLKKIYKYLIH